MKDKQITNNQRYSLIEFVLLSKMPSFFLVQRRFGLSI